jgi:hypothetical protein
LQRPPGSRQSAGFQQLIQQIEHQLLQAKGQLAQWFVRGKRYLSSDAKPKLTQQLSRGKPYLERQQLRVKTAWSALSTKLQGMLRPATYVGGGMVAAMVLLIILGTLLDNTPSSSTAKSSGYTYDDITIPATWCDNDNYVYAATNGKDYLSVCKTDSGYLFQALSDDGLTEGEAKKVDSSYVVNTENHVAVLEKDTMTITDTNGNVQSVVSLNRWLSK